MKIILLLNLIFFTMSFGQNKEVDLSKWEYEKDIDILNLKVDAKVVVPLEIITDLKVKATVIDDQKLEIPFTLVMNKVPDKEYRLKYSENIIDIDNDGRNDVEIISPKFIDSKLVENNTIVIEGKNIKEEGTYNKRVYISVEIKEGGRR